MLCSARAYLCVCVYGKKKLYDTEEIGKKKLSISNNFITNTHKRGR